MDIKELRKIMEKEKAKLIIVENGEPIMIVSPFDAEQKQLTLDASLLEGIDKKEQTTDNGAAQEKEVTQNTDLITKEDLPSDELTVEDLPF